MAVRERRLPTRCATDSAASTTSIAAHQPTTSLITRTCYPRCERRPSSLPEYRISGCTIRGIPCGTTMHLQGVPAAVIAGRIGHADVAFTMRTYMHSQPDGLAEGAQSLARVVTTFPAPDS